MFRHLFFFLLTHFSVGVIFTLLFVSLKEIGSLYFRLSTAIAAVLIFLALVVQPFGELQLSALFSLTEFTIAQKITYWFLFLTCVLLVGYNLVHPKLHGLLLFGAVVCGVVGVAAYALSRIPTDLGLWGQVLLITNGLGAAVILGSVLSAMITGHWYLVQHNLSLTPLLNTSKVFIAAVVFRALSLTLTLFFYRSSEQVVGTGELLTSMNFDSYLFLGRILIGLIIPFIFGVMVWKSAKIRSTQSATGILYATIVLILIGEAFSKFLYFVSGNPL